MPAGLQTTFDTLAATANEAAVPVLLAALDLPQREVREGALAALLGRHSPRAELELLRRWGQLSERWRTLIAQHTGWIGGAVRKAVLGRDPNLYQAACAAAVATRDYDLVPLLVGAALDKTNRHAELAAVATLQLAELLSEELAAPRDYRIRRDPQLIRQHVLGSLERAVAEFDRHGRRELVEAFLLLVERDNAVLMSTLQAPAERTSAPLHDALATSSRPGIERLLLAMLDDPHTPQAALHVIARRRDLAFLRRVLRKIGADPTPVVRLNLKRIDAVPWLQDNLTLLDALHESEQPGAVQLAVASSLPRAKVFEVVACVLRHGKAASRRVAAQALAEFAGHEADNLALRTMDDDDPQVRAAAARQLRERGVPGAISRLVELLNSPHQIEREAAQASLEDFSLERFLAMFDVLPPATRLDTGILVKRIDPLALTKIRAELDATTRQRKRRAIELALALDAVGELIEPIAALLNDGDQYLRIDAVRALATCDCPLTRAVLRDALLDSHHLVQVAAETALAQLARPVETVPAAARLTDTTLLVPLNQQSAVAGSAIG